MSRLKDLLRVAPPRPCNTQQPLVRVLSEDAGRVSQEWLQRCTAVTQYTQQAQQAGNDPAFARDWREFESLLAIVGPAYRTPMHDYAEMRKLAQNDIESALSAYREIVRQIHGS